MKGSEVLCADTFGKYATFINIFIFRNFENIVAAI
jgi:hypothetical protein